MKNIKENKYAILIIILILGSAFYWYSFRPSYITKNCHSEARENAISKFDMNYAFSDNNKLKQKVGTGVFFPEDYDRYFDSCLHSKGILLHVTTSP